MHSRLASVGILKAMWSVIASSNQDSQEFDQMGVGSARPVLGQKGDELLGVLRHGAYHLQASRMSINDNLET